MSYDVGNPALFEDPGDGWVGERVEFTIPSKSGLGYHFLIPKPLFEYIKAIPMSMHDVGNVAIQEDKPQLQEVELSYFKPSGKWYADGILGVSKDAGFYYILERVKVLARHHVLPGLVENHDNFHILINTCPPYLILINDGILTLKEEK